MYISGHCLRTGLRCRMRFFIKKALSCCELPRVCIQIVHRSQTSVRSCTFTKHNYVCTPPDISLRTGLRCCMQIVLKLVSVAVHTYIIDHNTVCNMYIYDIQYSFTCNYYTYNGFIFYITRQQTLYVFIT
jgi:hypothetical protein